MDDLESATINAVIFATLVLVTIAIYNRWLSKVPVIRNTVGAPPTQ
jgi:hypothetical protein